MKNVLAVDTASEQIAVLLRVDEQVASCSEVVSRNKLNRLPEIIQNLLGELGVSLAKLDYVAYGMGPGSFTGIRIGAALAESIAYGLGVPLVAFSSLQALAQTAADQLNKKSVYITNDARMNEIYFGDYAVDQQGIMWAQTDDKLLTQAAWQAMTLDENDCVDQQTLKVNPNSILKLVDALAIKQMFLSPLQIKLNYLRNNVTQG